MEFETYRPALRWLGRRRRVRPGWRTLWICQNRLREKRFLTDDSYSGDRRGSPSETERSWKLLFVASAAADTEDGCLGI